MQQFLDTRDPSLPVVIIIQLCKLKKYLVLELLLGALSLLTMSLLRVITPIPDLGNKLLLAEFSEIQTLQSCVIKAKKPSWKIGSSFALKKNVVKSLPKVQIDFDSDRIDENSLLSEEDLKKPVLPSGK
ncbi:anamorsin protein [Trifolium repens]|nr:anamorsin protein [Trifolium repens]